MAIIRVGFCPCCKALASEFGFFSRYQRVIRLECGQGHTWLWMTR